MTHPQRARHKAVKLRRRMDWHWPEWNEFPEKSPTMHWNTYGRLVRRALYAEGLTAVFQLRGYRSHPVSRLPFGAQAVAQPRCPKTKEDWHRALADQRPTQQRKSAAIQQEAREMVAGVPIHPSWRAIHQWPTEERAAAGTNSRVVPRDTSENAARTERPRRKRL